MPVSENPVKDYDIVIVGGGLVGASLAVALAGSPYRVAVIEAFSFDSEAQPSYDERTIALTYSARHIFTQLGAWDEELAEEACALNSIHISNRGHFGKTRLDHHDAGTEALGYVVPTRALGNALNKKLLGIDNIDFYCPYDAQSVDVQEHTARVSIVGGDTEQVKQLGCQLLVLADGGRSPLLNALGFVRESRNYPQSALLSIVKTSLPHRHRAYERFAEDGPLALLPLHDQRFAVVWTLAPGDLQRISSLSDEAYIEQLQEVFGTHAGLFSEPTPRKSYALSKGMLQTPCRHRVVALGNAAHTVHPVAGQGFNLGLRDVAELAENLLLSTPQDTDIGSNAFLQAYAKRRERDTRRVGQFTDGLLTLFTHRSPLIQLGRNLGLAAVENLPFAKRALLKRSMGMGRNQPRLARGLSIPERSRDD